MNKPHKHAALIKAWADGAEIQFQLSGGSWVGVPDPMWNADHYRVKPRVYVYRNTGPECGLPEIEVTLDRAGKVHEIHFL